jgi:hypothetical protein
MIYLSDFSPEELAYQIGEKRKQFKMAAQEANIECDIFSDEGNKLTKDWYTKIHVFLREKLGESLGKLSGLVKAVSEKDEKAHINGIYDPDSGDISLRRSAEKDLGYLLGTLLHELTHANLGEVYVNRFFSEGFVDYIDETLCKDSFWGKDQEVMYKAFVESNKQREINAKERPTELNVERWRGQEWARKYLGETAIDGIRRVKDEYVIRHSSLVDLLRKRSKLMLDSFDIPDELKKEYYERYAVMSASNLQKFHDELESAHREKDVIFVRMWAKELCYEVN